MAPGRSQTAQYIWCRQTAAGKHERGIKNDDSLIETKGNRAGERNPFVEVGLMFLCVFGKDDAISSAV